MGWFTRKNKAIEKYSVAECLKSRDNALKCIKRMIKQYDGIACGELRDVINNETVTTGNKSGAVALIESKGDVIGVIDEKGNIRSVEPPITKEEIESAPPPPPPPAPPVSIPTVKSVNPSSRKQLMQEVEQSKETKNRDQVLQDIVNYKTSLKKVEKCPVDFYYDSKIGGCVVLPKEAPKSQREELLDEIRKGKELNKVQTCQKDEIYDQETKNCKKRSKNDVYSSLYDQITKRRKYIEEEEED